MARAVLYLASQSPRRRVLLRSIRVAFKVIPSRYEERNLPRGISPSRLVIKHAIGKVRHAKIPSQARLILGADTIVYASGRVLGKPRTLREAQGMLKRLGGRGHAVYTGLALWDRKRDQWQTGYAKTKVFIRPLDLAAIRHYCSQVHPFDKAGAYAIQETPRIVKRIVGSRSNVVGLPLELLKKMLKKVGRS